jgi:hypothetical protein
MLVENCTFSKTIKESFILKLNVPLNKDNKAPQKLVDDIDDDDTLYKSRKENFAERPKAVVQSLNFLALSPTSQGEDLLYRENVATYYFDTDIADGPVIVKTPYLVMEKSLPNRHGAFKGTYPILEGSIKELTEYLAQETRTFYTHSGSNTRNKEDTEDKKTYPFSAINIPLPWRKSGETRPSINLPSEKDLAELVKELTNPTRSQMTILISGPSGDVETYHRKFTAELKKVAGRYRSMHQIASITVDNGYICANDKPSYEEIEAFKIFGSLASHQPELEKIKNYLVKESNTYIRERIKEHEAKALWSRCVPNSNEGQEISRNLSEAEKKRKHYESELGILRRASRLLKSAKKDKVQNEEDAVEKNISALARFIIKEGETVEAKKTMKEVQSELIDVVEAWFNIQKDLLKKKTNDNMHFEPWSLEVIHYRNDLGFSRAVKINPISISTKIWNIAQQENLKKQLEMVSIEETHLAPSLYSPVTGKMIPTYPKALEKKIANPYLFQTPPLELMAPNGYNALQITEKELPVKVDTRLSARPMPLTEMLLENDNLQIQIYNPVTGRPSGIKESTLWRPIITKKGIPYVEEALAPFGYKLEASPAVYNFAERKVKQAEKCLSPNYPLTPYESLAYFENGPRVAEQTILHPESNEPLWVEGKTYHITPSWKRQTMLVDHSIEEENNESQNLSEEIERANAEDIVTLGSNDVATRIQNSSRIQTLTERRINFGFATFIVEAEGNKTYEIRETVSKETISMEKERIATEIDHLMGRVEELEANQKRSKAENNELLKVKEHLAEKNQELDSWAPMLEDFLAAFPPEAPALTTEVYHDQIQLAMKKIYGRFAPFVKEKEDDKETSLKDYQLKWAAIGAVKRGHGNSSSPGSGKTLMSIMATWEMGHHYNWVICPTIAMKSWAKELERVGLYHEIVGFKKDDKGNWVERPNVYQHMRDLRARFHKRVRQHNRLGKIEPEYYIISAESVCLGGEGNRTYSPWHFNHAVTGAKRVSLEKDLKEKTITLPDHWSIHTTEKALYVRVWSDRADNAKEIKKYGWEDYLRPVRFSRAIKECPKCQATKPTWSKQGFCNSCGHSHSGITKVKSGWDAKKHTTKLSGGFLYLTEKPLPGTSWVGEKTSHKQYPLYKMMGKHVGCKIIDEVHNWSNFHSQHGAALLQVKTKDSIVLSGTLCKTHIHELEPSLCQIYEANSGEFPYSPWGMDLFKEQFQTSEIESTYRTRTDIDSRQVRRQSREKIVPEASNLTKLRALLHGVLCSVGETEMEKVWELKPIRETIRYVELQERNAAIYQEWERLMREAYEECSTEKEKVGMLRKARNQLTSLAYACDGPEKLEAAIEWIQEGMAAGKRSVIVGPSTRFYTMLCKALKERNIPFMGLGNMDPEKRFDYLNKFRDSDCPNFVSRIRLVNVNFNQLTCCTRILFTGIDPSPAAIRQMQKRLNRIGQTQPVECTYLISQLPVQRRRTANGSSIAEDIQDTIDALETGGYNPNPIEDLEEETGYRPPSYEERLFALVLRRENAIKQTLQQADRQRDPQELYEMLKDRQTLNQLLQDIVENTKTDTDITKLIRSMEEEKKSTPTEETEFDKAIQSSKIPDAFTAGDLQSEEEAIPINIEETVSKNKRGRKKKNSETCLPEPPEGYTYRWNPVKKKENVLQGEFFSF